MSTKKTLIDYATRSPHLVDNRRKIEALARGAYLEDVEKDEDDRYEITGQSSEEYWKNIGEQYPKTTKETIIIPHRETRTSQIKSIDSLLATKEAFDFVLENIPLPGRAVFYGTLSPITLGQYNERGYSLKLSSRQRKNGIIQSFAFTRGEREKEPEAKDYLTQINDFLIDSGYNSKFILDFVLEINGYKNNFLRKEKMEEIKKRGKDKIPIMREFLIVNFPLSKYGEGEANDLSKRSATKVGMEFDEKYRYVKRKCKEQPKNKVPNYLFPQPR